MTSRSMCDVAFELLANQKKEMPFSVLWEQVVKSMGFTASQAENKIAQFYSALLLDARFAPLAENVWDLRSRRKFNETHVDTSSIILEDEYISNDDDNIYLVTEDEKAEEKAEDDGESD
ncbi:MAG: DNA-directed RNA polymerase subunit delta [Erysipelotrichaceae bacterium]